jgi:heptosyltransferase-1
VKVLVIKISSLGDIIHTLPALDDASKAIKNIQFDWVLLDPFADIPAFSKHVDKVYKHGRLRWQKKSLSLSTNKERLQFYTDLRKTGYDLIIDAQGLSKSAKIGHLAKGKLVGLSQDSVTDPKVVKKYYQSTTSTGKEINAIEKVRLLFADSLGYELKGEVDYGLKENLIFNAKNTGTSRQLIFLHGTKWESKHWPDVYWAHLTQMATRKGFKVLLPWGNDTEKERAEGLAKISPDVKVLPKMSIKDIAGLMVNSVAAVGVDTGLTHLSAAIGLPTVAIFGPTNPNLTAAVGQRVVNLQTDFHCSPCMKQQCPILDKQSMPPCYKTLPAADVWETLTHLM